jgi:hypothetical protein
MVQKEMKKLILFLLLSSCVTINVYQEKPKESKRFNLGDIKVIDVPDYTLPYIFKPKPCDWDSVFIQDGDGWLDTIVFWNGLYESGDTLIIQK